MRSSILIVIGALALGCGGRQDDAQTTPEQAASPSGAEGAAPPPMAGQEMQGQEQPDETQEQDMEGQDAEGQGTTDPNLQSQGMQPGMQQPGMQQPGMQQPGMQQPGTHDMHAGHGQAGHGQAGGAQAGMTSEQDLAAACPMEVPGTKARAENVSGGVAIVFTTTQGDVADLQQRVQQMADLHNQHHAQGQTTAGQAQQGAQAQQGQQGAQAHSMIPAQARAENTARGARLVLIAQSAKQVKQVRQEIRKHAQQMVSSGQCSMMGHQAGMETPAQRNNRQAAGQPPPR